MSTLTLQPIWPDGVRHFESNAILTGGPDCPDNKPIQYVSGSMRMGMVRIPST
uniref:Uncharacterized protein n=1 Tax=Candidatus Kentrum sp. TC TaxID=2126339 RepID=A0A450Z5Q0_9GAMM|nr:MAG: hypothetical protein BECKTC1821E_GA0114239_11572 [Candidatus Kentron sp. TC]